MTEIMDLIDRANSVLAAQYRLRVLRLLDTGPCHIRVTDYGVENITPQQYRHAITPEMLSKRRPKNISLADWRMALRRKLNGDTR